MKHTNKLTYIVLSALITIIILTSCTQMFQPKLPMGLENSTSLGTLLEKEVEISQLDTPKQVFVSQGQSPNEILISWDAVLGATSYSVERAIVTDSTNTNSI